MTRLAAPPPHELDRYKSDKEITDEEVLKILEQPLAKESKKKLKKKKRPAKKAEDDEEESSEEE